jgi:hypothetical protein
MKKLILLGCALGLSLAASVSARPTLYIICETCTTSSAIYPCQCGSGSLHPSTLSNCNAWLGACYG